MPTDEQFGAFLEGEDAALNSDEQRQLESLRAMLGDDVVWEDPPDGLEDLVVRDIAGAAAPNVASLSGHRADRERKISGRLIAGIGAVAAALVLVVAVAITTNRPDALTAALVGTDLAPLATGVVTVEETGSGFSFELDIEGLDAPPEDFYYQAWVKGESGPITIGTFHARESSEDIWLWSGVEIVDYPTLTVTIQEEGAGPASSGMVVLTADLPQP